MSFAQGSGSMPQTSSSYRMYPLCGFHSLVYPPQLRPFLPLGAQAGTFDDLPPSSKPVSPFIAFYDVFAVFLDVLLIQSFPFFSLSCYPFVIFPSASCSTIPYVFPRFPLRFSFRPGMCNLFHGRATFEVWKVIAGHVNFYWMKLYSFPSLKWSLNRYGVFGVISFVQTTKHMLGTGSLKNCELDETCDRVITYLQNQNS